MVDPIDPVSSVSPSQSGNIPTTKKNIMGDLQEIQSMLQNPDPAKDAIRKLIKKIVDNMVTKTPGGSGLSKQETSKINDCISKIEHVLNTPDVQTSLNQTISMLNQ